MQLRRPARFAAALAVVGSAVAVGLVVLYLLSAALGGAWTGAGRAMACGRDCDREIFLLLDAVHADIVLPVAPDDPWFDFLGEYGAELRALSPRYLAIGWGSRTFYLETPTWGDVTLANVLTALAFDRSAIHVSPILAPLRAEPPVRRLVLDAEGLDALTRALRAGFRRGAGGAVLRIDASYGAYDAFFEAEGRYSPFVTCNVWTGAALRKAGVATGLWTPFAWSLAWSLPD